MRAVETQRTTRRFEFTLGQSLDECLTVGDVSGALRGGIKTVLIPEENEEEYQI